MPRLNIPTSSFIWILAMAILLAILDSWNWRDPRKSAPPGELWVIRHPPFILLPRSFCTGICLLYSFSRAWTSFGYLASSSLWHIHCVSMPPWLIIASQTAPEILALSGGGFTVSFSCISCSGRWSFDSHVNTSGSRKFSVVEEGSLFP